LSEAEIRSVFGRFARSRWADGAAPNRFANLTPEQRSIEASRAAKARWAKVRTQDDAQAQ
jgi:hypothetical protein